MGEDRAPGLHLGSIIKQMKIAAGENVSDIPGEQPGLRALEGFTWEVALEYMVAGMPMDEAIELSFKRYFRELRKDISTQVRLCRDGIHMTPDGFLKDEGVVESYKHTRRSLRNALTQEDFETNFWSWCVQEKSYALELGVDTTRWIVLWAAGDYSKGKGTGPMAMQATMAWSAQELADNWRTVLRYRDMMAEQEAKKAEMLAEGGEECLG